MKSAHIAVLVVRLLAFYLAVLAAMSATGLGFFLIKTPDADEMMASWALGTGITIALQCLLAFIVYAAAPRIAGEVSGEPTAEPIEDRLAMGRLALRIAGILIVENSCQYVMPLVEVQWYGGASVAGSRLLFQALLFITFVGLGVLLFLTAGPLARRLFATTAERDVAGSALAQAIGFSVLGACIVVGVLPGLLERLFAEITSENPDIFGLTRASAYAQLGTELFRLALGLVLFLSAGVIAHGWHKLRTAGLQRTDAIPRARVIESEP